MRTGIGYDVHRLVAGRPLIIGGVRIPHDLGLEGHSDADVLLHAIADAILGAASAGDIGVHFPDTDSEWKDADSTNLLSRVADIVSERGFRVVNVDATVAIEKPKLRPYIADMCLRISRALSIDVGQVSVKATTAEGLGFVGARKGASALAVCTLDERDNI